jgi:hypothetical protein
MNSNIILCFIKDMRNLFIDFVISIHACWGSTKYASQVHNKYAYNPMYFGV